MSFRTQTRSIRILFWMLGLFALAVGLAIVLKANDSFLVFHLPWQRIKITTNLFVLALIALFIGAYFLIRFFARIIKLPSQVRAYRQERTREQAILELQEAGIMLLSGRYGHSLRHAKEAYNSNVAPGLAALLAAKAAHALRDPELRDEWIKKAAEHDEQVRLPRLVSQTEFCIADRKFEDAASFLDQIFASGQRHIAALRLALQVEQARKRWVEVARLTRQLHKHKALSAEQAAPLLRKAMFEQLSEAEGDLSNLQRIWKSLPETERLDAAFLVKAVPLLIKADQQEIATNSIAQSLEKDWDSELALLYGNCQSADMRAQLAKAESWLAMHPTDNNLLRSLGQLCLRAQLWGKAQSYFEAALSQSSSREVHLELAKLAQTLDREEQAQRHYRAAAQLGS